MSARLCCALRFVTVGGFGPTSLLGDLRSDLAPMARRVAWLLLLPARYAHVLGQALEGHRVARSE